MHLKGGRYKTMWQLHITPTLGEIQAMSAVMDSHEHLPWSGQVPGGGGGDSTIEADTKLGADSVDWKRSPFWLKSQQYCQKTQYPRSNYHSSSTQSECST
uniref:Uncharacterized protein n=1 Tax=Eutreptiella gymnastica TaxID=73025 RepID=A0A7S1NGT8_9EUGL